jgi:hypothetical protein
MSNSHVGLTPLYEHEEDEDLLACLPKPDEVTLRHMKVYEGRLARLEDYLVRKANYRKSFAAYVVRDHALRATGKLGQRALEGPEWFLQLLELVDDHSWCRVRGFWRPDKT